MTMLPNNVGDLRRLLATYPDELEVMVQGSTDQNPNATPNRFSVEYWGPEDTDDQPFLLLAGIDFVPGNLMAANDPNASWSLPK